MRHFNPRNVMSMFGSLHATEYQQTDTGSHAGPRAAPFITISRQAGADGRSLAEGLARRLNERDPGDTPWTVWDNELDERVADQSGLSLARISALEDTHPSWLEELLGGLSSATGGPPPSSELTVFHRVAETIRALAEKGRVIIVGRGAAFVTADMPGGVHVRLVAPVQRRIEWIAKSQGISSEAAAKSVSEIDAARRAFYRRHFPNRPVEPEYFTVTLNTAFAAGSQLENSVLALVPREIAVSGNVAPRSASAGS